MMGAPNYSSADYLVALQALMPRGRVWPKEQDAVQTQALSGLAPVYARSNARASNLLVDAFPATAVELLPEWEESLGIDAGSDATLQGRQSQVVVRLTNTGGQSIPYFVALAKSLGYSVIVSEFTPFRMGVHAMGHQLGGQEWAFAWVVYFVYKRFGLPVGDVNILMDKLNAIKPAHTDLAFIPAIDDGFGNPFVIGSSELG